MRGLGNAWRAVVRSPGSTLVVVAVLALGIGINTAVLTLVNAVLWNQLPFRDPERLVSLWSKRSDRDKAPLSIADFEDFRRDAALEDAAAFGVWDANLTGTGETERLQGVKSTANMFQLLRVSAALGRALIPEDDRPGSRHVVVLTYGLWERRFGASSAVIATTLLLNGEPYTVAGVLPRDFFFPNPSLARTSFPVNRDVDFVVPLMPDEDPRRLDRGNHFLSALGRLKPGVGVRASEEQLNAVAQRLRLQYPSTNDKNTGVRLVGLDEEIVGNFRAELWLVSLAAAILFVMACSSLTNLSLTVASGRRYEFAIRSSLGATRAALVGQMVAEAILKALMGGAAAVGFAYGGVKLLVALAPAGLPRLATARLDSRSLAADFLLAIFSGLVIGVLPAFRASRSWLGAELRGGSRSTSDLRSSTRLRGVLSSVQVASSVILLITAGLLLRSFARLEAISPGFDPSNVLVTRLALMAAPFPTADSIATFHDQLRAEIGRLPGVRSVGAISILPMSGSLARTDFYVSGHPPASPEDTPSANFRVAGPGYFPAMRIPLIAGRDFSESDSNRARRVAIVNDALVRRFFGNSSAIGAHLRVQDFGGGEVEIIGVVGDVKQAGLNEEPSPDVYLPYAQASPAAAGLLRNNMYWVIRSGQNPLSHSTAVRHAVFSMNKDIAIASSKTLDQYLTATVAARRFNLVLLAAFAGSALLLAVIALYGVVSYSVQRRTREIGLRMALGAERASIAGLVLGQGLLLSLAGIGTGLAGALAVAPFLRGLLYDTQAFDTITFVSVAGLLLGAGIVASYVPARRAMRLDPLTALRED